MGGSTSREQGVSCDQERLRGAVVMGWGGGGGGGRWGLTLAWKGEQEDKIHRKRASRVSKNVDNGMCKAHLEWKRCVGEQWEKILDVFTGRGCGLKKADVGFHPDLGQCR